MFLDDKRYTRATYIDANISRNVGRCLDQCTDRPGSLQLWLKMIYHYNTVIMLFRYSSSFWFSISWSIAYDFCSCFLWSSASYFYSYSLFCFSNLYWWDCSWDQSWHDCSQQSKRIGEIIWSYVSASQTPSWELRIVWSRNHAIIGVSILALGKSFLIIEIGCNSRSRWVWDGTAQCNAPISRNLNLGEICWAGFKVGQKQKSE